MSDRVRLKDSDEILNSLGKRVRQTVEKRPEPQESGAGEHQDKGTSSRDGDRTGNERESDGELAEQAVASDKGQDDTRPSGARNRPPRNREELEERVQQSDANPLDFGKYELPKAERRSRTTPTPIAEEELMPPTQEVEPESLDVEEMTESNEPGEFPSLLEDDSTRNQFMEALGSEFERQFTQRFKQRTHRSAAEIMGRVAEEMGIRPKGEPVNAPATPPSVPPSAPPAEPVAQSGVSGPAAPVRQQVVAQRAPEQFEEFQEEAWEVIATNHDETLPELSREDEESIQQETESFLKQFAEETQQQEEVQNQDFKETLAEKFMRERERYLRELGIAEEIKREQERNAMEEAIQAEIGERMDREADELQTSRRVLDFQIQPEMHMGDGKDKAVRPVIYGRNAAVRPLDEDIERPYEFEEIASPEPPKPQKKTAEQLLLELAATKSLSQAQFQFAPPATQQVQRSQPAPLQMMKLDLGEQAAEDQHESKRAPLFSKWKLPGRTAILSVAAALLTLVVAGGLIRFLVLGQGNVTDELIPMTQTGTVEQEHYQAWESNSFLSGAHFESVSVEKTGITLENMEVDRTITIQKLTGSEPITLRNVTADKIHFFTGAARILNLDNVRAREIVIDNADASVEVRISGTTEIGKVEVYSAATVIQPEGRDVTVEQVNVRAGELDGTLKATLQNLEIPLVASDGKTWLTMESTQVDVMTADGILTLEGQGSMVRNLSAAKLEEEPLSLKVSIPVTNLNLKNEADLYVGDVIDNAFTGSNLRLSGTGSIANLDVNDEGSNTRLEIDLSHFRIQHLTANARSRVDSAGDSRINVLTANDSVYVMGNKVGRLVANSDGVYYENRPDEMPNVEGVSPPQAVADNPHLNFTKAAVEEDPFTDATEDPSGTTCGDPRDKGGFLKGNGSADNPFEVSTAAQLSHVSQHLDAYFIQTADIDISDESQFASGFSPIAAEGVPFTGVYDGGGYQIKNLRISSSGSNVGLFASNSGTIRNLHIMSGLINGNEGGSHTGSIVGINYDGGSVLACANGAIVSGTSFTGGIVGYNYGGRVENCYNYAKISGSGTIGGLVALNRAGGVIVSSYNVGTMEGESVVGALVGDNEAASITNCYYLENTAELPIGTGMGAATKVSSEELQSDQIILDLSVGNSESPWVKGSGAYDYPMLNTDHTVFFTPPAPSSDGESSASSNGEIGAGDDVPVETSAPGQQQVVEV